MHLLIVVLVLIQNFDLIVCETYYIVPSENYLYCQGQCITLSQFADNATGYLNSSTTVFIIGGNHHLDASISITDVMQFSMLSYNDTTVSSNITCSEHASFLFSNVISHVYISGLTLIGCDGSKVESVNRFTITHSRFLGRNNTNTSLTIVESVGNIIETYFLSNKIGITTSCFLTILSCPQFFGPTLGGALNVIHSNLTVDRCVFKENGANIAGAIFSEFKSIISINNSEFTSNSATGCNNKPCSSSGGAFVINESTTVFIYGSSFQNNTSDQDGGVAVIINSTLVVSQSILSNNTADRNGGVVAAFQNSDIKLDINIISDSRVNSDGGVLYLNKSTVMVRRCNIFNNTAKKRGGVIASNTSSFIILHSSNFSNSSAQIGGILSTEDSIYITIENCKISHNSAHACGGVVNAEYTSTITICNSTLENNIADSHGGVLHVRMVSSVTISSCNIQRNIANGSGGVIRAENVTTLMMSNISSLYNHADSSGGVVFLVENSTAVISDSTFVQNKALFGGGVISIRQTWTSALFIRCTFNSNKANDYGGVAHLRMGSSISVNDSTFSDNVAGRGGGVINGYLITSVKIYRTHFIHNKAIVGGGAVTIMRGGSFFAKESVFRNNSGSDLGAVIHLVNETVTIIHDCSFTDNSANLGGVLLAIRNNSITISNSTFKNNTARINGGVLYARSLCRVNISNCSFINNTAIGDGVLLISDQSNITILNSIFMNNGVEHDGGVAYVYNNCTLFLKDCNVTANIASNSGGIVYGLKSSNVTISRSRVHMNRALNSGGGFHIQQDSCIIIECSMFINNAADYGGVLRVYAWSSAIVVSSLFIGNRAGIAGGTIAAYRSSTVVVEECNFTCNMANFGGVVYVLQNNYIDLENGSTRTANFVDFGGVTRVFRKSVVTITGSNFDDNVAEYGGVLNSQSGKTTINSCSFTLNRAIYNGGCMFVTDVSTISVMNANFTDNVAVSNGGVISVIGESMINMIDSMFMNNTAQTHGGVIYLQQSNASICNSAFRLSNAGQNGGAIMLINGSMKIENSSFLHSAVPNDGGVIIGLLGTNLIIFYSTFISNTANHSGGVLYLADSSKSAILNSTFERNKAQNTGGALSILSESQVKIMGSIFNNNTAMLGAALAAVQKSYISFESFTINGVSGTLQSTYESQKNRIQSNIATSRGGIYLSNSFLYFGIKTSINHNHASESGGGVHADTSSITIKDSVDFDSNEARNGGGISLKNSTLSDVASGFRLFGVIFTSNQADYGGALYVDDEAQDHVCSSNPLNGALSGCFFENVTEGIIKFNNNYANTSGDNLFGGLLDRCSVVDERDMVKLNGAARFEQISNIDNLDTISSKPVRVCLCNNDTPNCSHETHYIRVKYRNGFSFPVAAVDQVNSAVSATIQSNFLDLTVTASQTVRRIDAKCSSLEYHVPFPEALKEYHLNVYAQGPCNDKSISNLNVNIYVESCSCPPGFVPANQNTKCDCICDNRFSTFSRYIHECDASTGMVIKRGLFWITYIHHIDYNNVTETPYFIYPYCPVDYCHPISMSIPIDLNQSNGSDAQCVNNRHGILCGSCRPNYSLSLGSSKCIKCPDNWYGMLVGILVAAFCAGILLVFILLVLNVTVAVGTLNSIIFYANILNANRITYFSKSHLTFVPVFISWLNLDIGFDTCFFEGMDIYTKTWIQLAFPAYIIILVVVIIWVSSCSSRFSNLIGKRNPVATLATLILFSYTRLLQTMIASFSYVSLNYPNGTTILAWLPNANIKFVDNKLKLVFLMCVAICILFVGLCYTILITSWQFLLRCSKSKIFGWTKNPKLYSFVDTYHTPYTAKHRYWTGLLLLIRVIVYLVAASSASSEQPITLLSTIIIMCCLLLYKNLWTLRVYRNWTLNALETFMFFNSAIFAVCTLYTFNNSGYQDKKALSTLQRVVAYVSVGSTLFLLLLIVIFHIYRYGSTKVYSLLHSNTNLSKSYDNRSPRDHTFATSESIILDAIDSPRTIHTTPFIRFQKAAEHSPPSLDKQEY